VVGVGIVATDSTERSSGTTVNIVHDELNVVATCEEVTAGVTHRDLNSQVFIA